MTTLWRGATPTIARAIVVNAAQLGTYSQAKDTAKKSMGMEEGIKLHFVAAMISGLVTTIASMPVDIVKTRLQNQKVSLEHNFIKRKFCCIPYNFFLVCQRRPRVQGRCRCFRKNRQKRRIFRPLEGFLPLLLPPRSTHRPDVYLC